MIQEEPSKVELIKAASDRLRGEISTELRGDDPLFGEASMQLLKFHGVYQQEDRDRRREARRLGLAKHHQMMIRTRIPGGVLSADSYLAHDAIAEEWGNGTMRITTRQDFQLHGVLKGDLRRSIRAINASLLTTLGGCGDVARNIMCCPAPFPDPLREALRPTLAALVEELTPRTRAYHEIWLDGELAADLRGAEDEPLYGDRYLPRKFKTAIAMDGDNCVDVYANDLGLVAHRSQSGSLDGFTVLVGGGLGRHRNKPDTFAAVAAPLADIAAADVVAVARAVIEVQRDNGNRSDRRHGRLKYLIAARGLAWFRAEVQARLDVRLGDPRPLDSWPRVEDHLGWHEQGEGRLFLGVHVENGRVADTPTLHLRTALREIATTLHPQFHLTPLQNIVIAGLEAADHGRVETILERHGIRLSGVPVVRQLAMACPAIPTCGLAVAESERVLPSLVRDIERLVVEVGLRDEPLSVRMTGCPNGCARPYLGDVGLVGTTLGKYDLFLGGDPGGTRLNTLFAPAVTLESVCAVLRPLLAAFAAERNPSEAFGDWCSRVGTASLQRRFPVEGALVEVAEPVAAAR